MISKLAKETSSFIVMDVLEKAQDLERLGHEIIHLELGEPDFKTPEPIINAGIKAMRDGKTSYTHSLGLLELREAIAEHYLMHYHVSISPEQILVTSGSSPAMLILFQTILDSGDRFILPNPYYACYPNFIKATGGIPQLVSVTEENAFQYDLQQVNSTITENTKGIFINSPSNPSGSVIHRDKLKALSALKLPYIVSDEIYHGLSYIQTEREHSILEFNENAIVINGFSKAYAMTGWRLGYLIAPKSLIRHLQKLQQNYFISANNFVQWAGIAALTQAADDLKMMKETYNHRRIFMIKRLKEMGFQINQEPEGAFYVFVNASHLSKDSRKLAFDILEKVFVAVAPGIDFGSNGEGYLRFSYANSMENIEIGLERISSYINNLKL